MKRKPELHLHGMKRKSAAVASLAMLSLAGLALAQATPALADPTVQYVAVGSDTVQDVENQFAIDASGNLLGSYNATNQVTNAVHEVITPDKTTGQICSFARPNGSGEGREALGASLGLTDTGTPVAPAPQSGCVDIARSSSTPPSANVNANGALVFIPFAIDAVAGSTGPAAAGTVGGVATQATKITTAGSFTLADLKNLYDNCTPVTEGGVTYDPKGTTSGDTPIDLYIPQPGSGTRSFWESTLGFTDASLPTCVHDHIIAGVDNGNSVEEHDGTAVATDPNGFGPFSVAQWISQRNGHDDRRHGAQVYSLNGVSPFSNGSATTGALNTAFPITREVFNVVQYSRVAAGGANFDAGLASLLVGPSSFVCSDSFQIRQYGFATLPATASTFDTCGSISNANLRAF
ncbi:MAG TPA: hypothetical protein VH478_26770 [Trebonia sp.]|jgi:phosphate transport system substrate-binding protein|nr:hypothetical protein [Trebonia sp.]